MKPSSFQIKNTSWIIFLILFLYHPSSGCADIYRYIDEQGVIHFSNVPINRQFERKYQIYVKNTPYKKDVSPQNAPYDKLIVAACKKHTIPFSLVKAIIKVESDFNPNAVSRAGAKGLMQIMPSNFKSFNINNPFDPEQSINGGVSHFRYLIDRFKGDIHLALAAYNAGISAVERYKGIPPYPETQTYIKKVMHFYRKFKDQYQNAI